MGYGDWTQITVANNGNEQVDFRGAALQWGKFYSCQPMPNKDHEVTPDQVDKLTVSKGASYMIGSCGRENTWSGCQGQFDLWDDSKNSRICTIFFYSPHGASYNSFRVEVADNTWSVNPSGGYFGNDGPLGSVTVTLARIN